MRLLEDVPILKFYGFLCMFNTGEKKCVRACVGRNYRYLDNEAGVNKLIPRSFQIVRLVK
jgi:hypothetical protein